MKRRIWIAGLALLAAAGCQDVAEVTGPESEVLAARGSQSVDVIVVLDRDFAPGAHVANVASARDIAQDLGLSPTFAYGTVLFGFAASVPEGRLGALASDPRVDYVDMDGVVHIPGPIVAAPPCGVFEPCGDDGGGGQTLPWGVDRVDADLNSNTGSGVHVYVIDTGIDSDHADLQANLGNGFAVETCKGGSCNTDWDDDHGHGTHVAGTVGAIDNDIDVIGVAPAVTLHAVKVLSKSGSGTRSGVIAGIDWVTSEVSANGYGGHAVANMSLGGSGSKSGTCDTNGFSGTDSYHQAICESAHVGVVYAVAAGNDGADAENSVPAAYDDAVITVSATNRSDEWESWSNWGDNTSSWDPDSNNGPHAPVAIGAPGGSILSTAAGGGTTTMSGTSMASPHVAGGAALFVASNAQAADYTAFVNTRQGILSADEDASGFGNEDPSNPHEEDFLDAGSL